MRVVLADDHRTVREGLRWMLSESPDVEVVGEAADGAELLALLAEVDADIVVLDVNMPGMGGLEALETITAMDQAPKVIILSMHDRPVYVRRAVELGASGYLLKSAGRDELMRAFEAVMQGGAYVQSEITGHLLAEVAGRSDSASYRLSPRQTEILGLVAAGLENKQIARRLDLSETTVKTYLGEAFDRLGAHSRAEAVAIALREHLID